MTAMKPAMDILAYIDCVVYAYPCGCKLTLKYGKAWNAAPERLESCGGAIAVRDGERGQRIIRRGADICEEALNHCAGDVGRRAKQHAEDPVLRREWYTEVKLP
jgi:hypothetical protein